MCTSHPPSDLEPAFDQPTFRKLIRRGDKGGRGIPMFSLGRVLGVNHEQMSCVSWSYSNDALVDRLLLQ